jgi:hypothetical protein
MVRCPTRVRNAYQSGRPPTNLNLWVDALVQGGLCVDARGRSIQLEIPATGYATGLLQKPSLFPSAIAIP